jgi:low temperature requirement protein LtrA
VALGESVASVGIGAAEHPLDAQIVLSAVLGLGVSAALWWVYFGGADDELAAAAMLRAPRTRRPSLALSAYFYPHIPILLGVVGLAAGVKLTIGHAAQPHPAAQALAIGGGVALFLAGHAAFRWALHLGPVRPRLVTALFALATAALGATVAIEAQLIVLLAGLAAMLAIERLRGASALSAEPRRPAAPDSPQ